MSCREALRPFRYFQLCLTSGGERRLNIRVGNPDRAGPDLQILMREGNVIKSKEISGWFGPLRIAATDHELSELVDMLNLMRVTRPREEAVPDPPELKAVQDALAVVATDVPVLICIQQKAIAEAGPNATARDYLRRVQLVSDLSNLLIITHTLQADPFMVPAGPKRRTAFWHRDLAALAFLVEGIAKKHSIAMSLTKADSRGVEFLRKALERAGIHQDCQAIAKEMKRAKKDSLPEAHIAEA